MRRGRTYGGTYTNAPSTPGLEERNVDLRRHSARHRRAGNTHSSGLRDRRAGREAGLAHAGRGLLPSINPLAEGHEPRHGCADQNTDWPPCLGASPARQFGCSSMIGHRCPRLRHRPPWRNFRRWSVSSAARSQNDDRNPCGTGVTLRLGRFPAPRPTALRPTSPPSGPGTRRPARPRTSRPSSARSRSPIPRSPCGSAFMCFTTRFCSPSTDRTRSQVVSVWYTIATAHSNTEHMR